MAAVTAAAAPLAVQAAYSRGPARPAAARQLAPSAFFREGRSLCAGRSQRCACGNSVSGRFVSLPAACDVEHSLIMLHRQGDRRPRVNVLLVLPLPPHSRPAGCCLQAGGAAGGSCGAGLCRGGDHCGGGCGELGAAQPSCRLQRCKSLHVNRHWFDRHWSVYACEHARTHACTDGAACMWHRHPTEPHAQPHQPPAWALWSSCCPC